jgi:hypothetical protein
MQPPSAQLEMKSSEKGPWAISIAPANRLVQARMQGKAISIMKSVPDGTK